LASFFLYKKKIINNSKHINNLNYNNFLLVNKKNTHSFSKKKSIIYINSLLNKFNILKENKDKSGIYR
jgi:hypothetical protein